PVHEERIPGRGIHQLVRPAGAGAPVVTMTMTEPTTATETMSEPTTTTEITTESTTTTITAPHQEPQRIRGLEMPWNRVLGSTEGPASAARALGPWHPQEFLAECVEIVPEVGGMLTFVFRRLDGAPLAFRPGQYVNIA